MSRVGEGSRSPRRGEGQEGPPTGVAQASAFSLPYEHSAPVFDSWTVPLLSYKYDSLTPLTPLTDHITRFDTGGFKVYNFEIRGVLT